MSQDLDPQLRDLALRFNLKVGHPRHVGDGRPHFLGLAAHDLQVVAVELNGHLSLHTREHVGDQVRQGLLDAGGEPGFVQGRSDLCEDFLPAPLAVRIEGRDELGRTDGNGVFIELGPARLADQRDDVVDLLEILCDLAGHLLRSGQRGARLQNHVDLHGSFVKRWQEIAFQLQ